ncbi:MAG: MarR family transcriptional regulator [Faecalibacterium prausnitzii]
MSSRSIAEKLGVTKPSVVRILNLLMEQGMIVKGVLR